MSYWIVDGQKLTNEQYEELERQKRLKKQKIQEESERLSRQLSEAYEALKAHLSRHKGMSQRITDERELEQRIYANLQQNLERANHAPRCAAIKEDGTGCGSPRIKGEIYCYAHSQMMEARAKNLLLPALQDANSILMAVMVVQRALIDDEISEKKAALLLYSIQIAAAKVGKATFGQAKDEELVANVGYEDEVIEENARQREQTEQIEEIRAGQTLPRINTDEREPEEQNLPLMINTEDTDLQKANLTAEAQRRGELQKTLPRINTDNTDSEEIGRILGAEVYANQNNFAETHANLG